MTLQAAMTFVRACREGRVAVDDLGDADPSEVRRLLFARAAAAGFVFAESEFDRALRLDVAARLAPRRGSGRGDAAL